MKVRPAQGTFQRKSRFNSKGDEAREVLANTVLNHVPVIRYNFQAKVSLCPYLPNVFVHLAVACLDPGGSDSILFAIHLHAKLCCQMVST